MYEKKKKGEEKTGKKRGYKKEREEKEEDASGIFRPPRTIHFQVAADVMLKKLKQTLQDKEKLGKNGLLIKKAPACKTQVPLISGRDERI